MPERIAPGRALQHILVVKPNLARGRRYGRSRPLRRLPGVRSPHAPRRRRISAPLSFVGKCNQVELIDSLIADAQAVD